MKKILFGLMAAMVLINGVAMANHHDDHGDDHDEHGDHHLFTSWHHDGDDHGDDHDHHDH